jgi:nucleoside-diphosphate-sugar epimerase
MKIFITGATGYIGNLLAHKLADAGHCVHALIRNENKAYLLDHDNIKIFFGDITNKEEIRNAIRNCEQVYHVAGNVKTWMKDPSAIFKINVEGTSNVLEEALAAGAKKLVFTSTCGVIGPALKEPMTEKDPRMTGYTLDYELSKKLAEDIVQQYIRKGLNAVIVSPSKVYGPGKTSHSLTYNAIIEKFLYKGFVLIPYPGDFEGCFGYIDDVVNGHILAMEKGKTGEKYILGGVNLSYRSFFQQIKKIYGSGRIIKIPKIIIKGWAYWQWFLYKLIHKELLFTPAVITHFYRNYIFSSDKAICELGYKITPLEEAIHKTIHFLNQSHHA